MNNKLNVHAPEFTINRERDAQQPMGLFAANPQFLQHSKSSGNIQQQLQLAVARRHAVQMANLNTTRTIFVSHPLQLQQLNSSISMPQSKLQIVNTNGTQLNVSW